MVDISTTEILAKVKKFPGKFLVMISREETQNATKTTTFMSFSKSKVSRNFLRRERNFSKIYCECFFGEGRSKLIQQNKELLKTVIQFLLFFLSFSHVVF